MGRPPHRELEDVEPGTVRRGWQHEACSRVERRHRRTFSHTPAQVRALIRSQGGGGAVLYVAPTSPGNDAASSFVPGDFPPTPPPGTPSVCALVPMWPFTRFSGPSSRRVCTCRGAQSEGVYSGECSGENLQRSPGTRSHQSHGS